MVVKVAATCLAKDIISAHMSSIPKKAMKLRAMVSVTSII